VDITIRKLEAPAQTDEFDCGNSSLNDYLRRDARQNQRRMFGVTHVAVSGGEQPCKVIGYFTLANTSIPRQGLPESLLKGVPKYQGLPAFLLARLAVDKAFQGRQIGELLLSRCYEHCLYLAKYSGARYLIADAKPAAISWYERYNFQRIAGNESGDSVKMFVDLEVVRTAMEP
jgi:ribosomal protein S18 acetylase RimI-like enzyme